MEGERLAEERVSILGMETTGRRGLLRTFRASSLAEILAQNYGEREPSRESFLGTRDKGRGAAQSWGRKKPRG